MKYWVVCGLLFALAAAVTQGGVVSLARADDAACPPDMVAVRASTAQPAASVRHFCIDRYEASAVDHASGRVLSPYYPPNSNLLRYVWDAWEHWRHYTGDAAARQMPLPAIPWWQRSEPFAARAVSRAGVVPQAYISFYGAKDACARASKRLCSGEEWELACAGQQKRKYPYGDQFRRSACNVYQYYHPALVLHGATYLGHLDPRLNLLVIGGDEPLLRLTGATPSCASQWGDDAVYDMVGNLDEWVADESGSFRGGFYARSTMKGCEARVSSHSVNYYDYSTGFRCCK